MPFWARRALCRGKGVLGLGLNAPAGPLTRTRTPRPTHCLQTFGEGLRPRVATLSWEEEEEEPEEEGRGPLRVRGRGPVASPSILER